MTRWLHGAGGRGSGRASETAVEELEAEQALLREENARLRVHVELELNELRRRLEALECSGAVAAAVDGPRASAER
jgi:hypothetical protein